MERLAVTAKLKPGTQDQAKALIERGPPFDLGAAGFERHTVYLSHEEVVFVFEGAGVEQLVRELVDDPVRSAAFGAWGPLLADRPGLAFECFFWSRS